jgi:hypothetical protein
MAETSGSAPSSKDEKDELLRKAYGAMLRKWRKRNGKLKQTALSWKAGLPAYAVGALERGERPIILEEIILICKALDLDTPTLLADVREHLREMVRPIIQDLQPGEGSPAELKRAQDLVSERAETLISSVTELDPDQGSG